MDLADALFNTTYSTFKKHIFKSVLSGTRTHNLRAAHAALH